MRTLGSLLVAFVGLAAVSVASSAPGVRELPHSPSWQNGRFVALATTVTYRAGLVEPAPSIRAAEPGWRGTQLAPLEAGKLRYESAVFLGHEAEVDLVAGPAMTLTPAAAIEGQLRHVRYWKFADGEAPTPVRHWSLAGRKALYFEATDPGPSAWALVGSNPAEVQAQRGESFRMAAFAVHGKTVVVVIRSQKASFPAALPAATRLLATLRFPA
jgi:hypothetical protein